MDSIPVAFKEIIPDINSTQKWREIVLNTGGTHSTLQDIKLPQRAGGYCYESKKSNTRNRFIYWQTTADSIELCEASLDASLTGGSVRCKVAPGTPPLDVSLWERAGEVVALVSTVSSVHRLHFPHPDANDNRVSFGGVEGSMLSIFHDVTTVSANHASNYYILPQYSTNSASIAHSCSSWLSGNGEAVWALTWGRAGGGDAAGGGLLLVRLPPPGAGSPVVINLKMESTVPRFLSGLTGALRGKSGGESTEPCGAAVWRGLVVAVCCDACLRVWSADAGGAPLAVSPSLAARPAVLGQGHRLSRYTAADGGLVLVVFLAFPSECQFVAVKLQQGNDGVLRFTNICTLYGPQLELVDYQVSGGDDAAIWALWSRPDGDTVITTSSVSASASWRAVGARDAAPQLPVLPSHQHYADRLLAPGLFSAAVIKKALAIYRRTRCGGEAAGGEGDVREAALAAVQARLRHAARARGGRENSAHRCWSDLYSWCVQYMEGLHKPLGLMVPAHEEAGWWCGVVRRGGLSFIRELTPLERLFLNPDLDDDVQCELSAGARAVLVAGARWERCVDVRAAADMESKLLPCTEQHRLLPRLMHLVSQSAPALSPQNIDILTAMLEPIEDLQKAVLELNEVLRLDVPELDVSAEDLEGEGEYRTLFSSELGVSVVTEAIRQMAELRGRMVRGAMGALVGARGADGVPGSGHCLVHWQAYRALLWLRSASLHSQQSTSDELFRLKLSVLNAEESPPEGAGAACAGGAVWGYAAGAGGARARRYLAAARAPTAWNAALPLMLHHLAYQMWAVSGGFEFGWWLASINQPKLVQNYVALLEPWCEWNACSRQLILGTALLDSGDTEAAYTALCKAAKGVSSEPFLRGLVSARGSAVPATQHKALVLYYLKVIRLFEIHDAGACVVRLAETAISIADKDDPNLAMLQWLVFKWQLSAGRTARALSAAAANPAPHARANAAATLLTTLAARKQLDALVQCTALGAETERAATARAKLHEPHVHNPYYSFLYALHVTRGHYRRAAMVMYERASRCASEPGGHRWRRRCLVAALTCLRLARPEHAFVTLQTGGGLEVVEPEQIARELRELDAQHPETRRHVETLLPEGDNVDYEQLRLKLKDSGVEAIHVVVKRLLNMGHFLPHWLLKQYMETDCAECARTLLGCGLASQAAAVLAECLRERTRSGMTAAHPAPVWSPLAVVDLVLAETGREPSCKEAYEELQQAVDQYMKVVTRTSEDLKLARIRFPVAS